MHSAESSSPVYATLFQFSSVGSALLQLGVVDRGGPGLAAGASAPSTQPTVSAVSSMTNDVCSELSSVPVNVSVTVWPAKPATLNERST